MERITIRHPYRFAVDGIHVVDVPAGEHPVGRAQGEVHPDAAAWGVKHGRAVTATPPEPKAPEGEGQGGPTPPKDPPELPPGVVALENHHYQLPDGSKVHGRKAMQDGMAELAERAEALAAADKDLAALDEQDALDAIKDEDEPAALPLYLVREYGRAGGPRESVVQALQVRAAELAQSPPIGADTGEAAQSPPAEA